MLNLKTSEIVFDCVIVLILLHLSARKLDATIVNDDLETGMTKFVCSLYELVKHNTMQNRLITESFNEQ